MESVHNVASIAVDEVNSASSITDVYALKTHYVGQKGVISEKLRNMKSLPAEERASFGKAINIAKASIEQAISKRLEELQQKEQLQKLGNPIDPSLTWQYNSRVQLHILSQVLNRITDIFSKLGYSIVEGPEVDTEWFCFDALNVPQNHPARNENDTFFLKKNAVVKNLPKHSSEDYILRAHTSTTQIRTMLKNKPPVRILSPGRVFRRDTVDATHNFNFYQIEGLCVDENISVADLKGTLDFFVKEFFGKEFKTRFRPSFFPFTEPSFEMDIYAKNLGKFKDRWLEVGGCGIVNEKVFQAVNYDSSKFTGFAFGFGLERLTMLLYNIDDVRRFYTNDERFLNQF